MIKHLFDRHTAFSLSLLLLVSLCLPHAASAGVAGHFQFVAGDVSIAGTDGSKRPAIKGGEINEQESIISGRTGSAQLRMIDNGIVAVRPDTTLRIDEYRYGGKENGNDRGFFSLLKGGFRSITGLIGKLNKDSYGIKTPAATIGIRGTDHETIHLAAALPNMPEGTYNKVNTGATIVNGTLIGPNQSAFTPNLNVRAIILPHIPLIFNAPSSPPPAQGPVGMIKPGNGGLDNKQSEENKGEQQKPGGAGGMPLGPVPAPGSTLLQQTAPLALMPPPPMPQPLPPMPSTLILAPLGTGGVGGDISFRKMFNGTTDVFGAFAGGGSIVVEGTNQTILFDSATLFPVVVAEKNINGSMQYSAGTAKFIDAGKTTIGTAEVVWGRYVGADQFIDSMGTRDPLTMNLMFTKQAMSFIQANNYFQTNSHAFTIVPGAGNIVDSLGATYTATGSLNVTASASPAVTMNITASNAARTWGLTYNGNLQQFYQNNCGAGPCGLPLTAATLSTGASIIKGEAGGVFIGPNAIGALTSFSANAFDASGNPIVSLQGTSAFSR